MAFSPLRVIVSHLKVPGNRFDQTVAPDGQAFRLDMLGIEEYIRPSLCLIFSTRPY